jgi:WD40 repeat protein/uncharacterized caspase-like protein
MRCRGVLVVGLVALAACSRPKGSDDTAHAPAEPAASQAAPEPVVQGGHMHYVQSVAFHPERPLVASCANDGVVCLWDLRSGKQLRTLRGAVGPLYEVAVSPRTDLVAALGLDARVHVWDAATGREKCTLEGHGNERSNHCDLEFSPDGNMLASYNGGDESVWLWKLDEPWAPYRVLRHEPEIEPLADSAAKRSNTRADQVRRFTFSPNGKSLVSLVGGRTYVTEFATGLTKEDKTQQRAAPTLLVWDVGSGKVAERLTLADAEDFADVRFSPAGDALAVLDVQGRLRLCEFGPLRVVEESGGPWPAVRWRGEKLACLRRGGGIATWSRGEKLPASAASETARGMSHVHAASADGTLVASIRGMGFVVAEAATGATLWDFHSHTDGVTGSQDRQVLVSWSPDGSMLATAGLNGYVRLMHLDEHFGSVCLNAEDVRKLPGNHSELLGRVRPLVRALAFDALSKTLAVSGPGGDVTLWDTGTGLKVAALAGSKIPDQMAFHPDGRTLACAWWDHRIGLWDLATGELRKEAPLGAIESRSDQAFALRYVSGGAMLCVAYKWGLFATLDGETLDVLDSMELEDRSNEINDAAWDADGKRLALARGFGMLMQVHRTFRRDGNRVDLVDCDGQTIRKELRGHTFAVRSVALSPNGRLVAGGGDDAQIKIWELAGGKETATLADHQSTVDSLAFSPDGRRLLSGSQDHSFKIWDVERAELVATLVTLDPDDMIVAAPDGYYAANQGGFGNLAFRFGGEAVPPEQFDLRWNRPDVILSRFGLASEDVVARYRALYERRLRRMNLSSADLSGRRELPEAQFDGPVPYSTSQRSLPVSIHARDARHNLARLMVYVNDVPIRGRSGIDLGPLEAREVRRTVDVALGSGRNKVQVAVLNERGIESLKDTVFVQCEAASAPTTLHVVCVGVSRYRDRRLNLQYAAKDALDVGTLFRETVNQFDKVEVTTLTDQQATREGILALKNLVRSTRTDDGVVLFFAGHGMLDDQANYYFVTWDCDPARPAERGLAYDEIQDLVDGIPARRRLVLLDTCHAGEVDEAAPAPHRPSGAPQEEAAEPRVATSFRGLDIGPASTALRSPGAWQCVLSGFFADLRRGSGSTVIAAAGGAEFALESASLQNGVFTSAVLRGLRQSDADLDDDYEIRVSELRDFVGEEVLKLTRGQQRPVSRLQNMELDFSLRYNEQLARRNDDEAFAKAKQAAENAAAELRQRLDALRSYLSNPTRKWHEEEARNLLQQMVRDAEKATSD